MSNIFKSAQSEQDFLITLIAEAFCKQFGTKFNINDYDIESIRPRVGYRLGYQVTTKNPDDYIRFRAYFNMADESTVSAFRNYVEQGYTPNGTLEDEVLVAFGTLDTWLRQEKVYTFRPLNNADLEAEYLQLEESTGNILLESGEPIELEKG